ncbi:MAG: recombinase family protein [Anaerobutyricum hallii]
MIYGYRRSVYEESGEKDGNSLEAQEAVLKAAGAQKIYSGCFYRYKITSSELDKLLEVIQPGDTLIVNLLDRIARSASQGTGLIFEALLKKDIIVHILTSELWIVHLPES